MLPRQSIEGDQDYREPFRINLLKLFYFGPPFESCRIPEQNKPT